MGMTNCFTIIIKAKSSQKEILALQPVNENVHVYVLMDL